jgi:signal peptidase I
VASTPDAGDEGGAQPGRPEPFTSFAETMAGAEATEPGAPKRWLAALLSFLLPGLGHFYSRRFVAGLLWFAAPLVLTVALAASSGAAGRAIGFGGMGLLWLSLLLAPRVAAPVEVLRRASRPIRAWDTQWLILAGVGMLAVGQGTRRWLVTRYVEAFRIPSAAMAPALLPGDHVFAEARTIERPVARGDIVVFDFPEDPAKAFVKRAVGVPGDRIEIRAGALWINGWQVPRCELGTVSAAAPSYLAGQRAALEYLGDAAYVVLGGTGFGDQGPFAVQPEELFVLGDNRDNSLDSRMWAAGRGAGVPFGNLRGRVLFFWWSQDPTAGPRWDRLGLPAAAVHLPRGLEGLAGALERCMAARPARTTPPEGLASGPHQK